MKGARVKPARWVASGLILAALVADVMLGRHVPLGAFAGGVLGIALASALALVIASQRMRALTLAALVVLFGWSGAFFAGSMYATCDTGMRPFIIFPLLAIFVPEGLLISRLIFVSVPVSLLLGFLASRISRRVPGPLTYAFLIASIPLVSVITFFIETAFGAHPTPGNCVI
jgi:hypothetical protein